MNERQYLQHLADIEFRNPGEPLLSTLRGGWSKVNVLYMSVAIRRMPTHLEEDEEVVQLFAGNAEKPGITATITFKTGAPDETLRKLWSERTRLFGQMNKQSNVFHTCKTDQDRAENSIKVLGWWKDIQAVKARIGYYEQNGELPAEQVAEDELSDNPVALGKQLSAIRVRISQTQSKITSLAGLDPNTSGLESKIQDYETKLRGLKHLRGLAEEKLKSHGQAEG